MTIALLATLSVAALTSCDDSAERAVDCGKLALAVSKSIDDLERAALGSALDRDATEVSEKLDKDIEKIEDRVENPDLEKAADKVKAATKDVHTAIREDRKPDMSPLRDAGVELTKVCARG